MRKLFLSLIIIFTLLSNALSSYSATRVKGYTKKNGTHVAPHQRSDKNSTKSDNWSTKGNVNPYTGKKGTKKAY